MHFFVSGDNVDVALMINRFRLVWKQLHARDRLIKE